MEGDAVRPGKILVVSARRTASVFRDSPERGGAIFIRNANLHDWHITWRHIPYDSNLKTAQMCLKTRSSKMRAVIHHQSSW